MTLAFTSPFCVFKSNSKLYFEYVFFPKCMIIHTLYVTTYSTYKYTYYYKD